MFRPNQRDNDLEVAGEYLPANPNQTVTFSPIQLEVPSPFAFVDPSTYSVVEVPALNATELPDGTTLTLKIFTSDELTTNPTPSRITPGTETVIATLVITGANGEGSPAQELRAEMWLFPPQKYVAASMTSGDGTSDMSALAGNFRVVT